MKPKTRTLVALSDDMKHDETITRMSLNLINVSKAMS